MAAKGHKPRLVRVEWLDAISKTCWSEKESVQDWIASPIVPVVSVGFLLRDDPEAIVIAADENEDEWGGITKIPKNMVVRVDYLSRKRGTNEKKTAPP